MQINITTTNNLRGTISVPGDKSISHRALMLGAIARGRTVVSGLSSSADCASTSRCLQQLGVAISLAEDGATVIDGKGMHGLVEANDVLDAGNSGTTVRLLSGILAGQPFCSMVTGDSSLRRRPMERVLKPLVQMGASALGRSDNRLLPLAIRGGVLKPIRYTPPVPSAQVKSAVLLAGLYADGETIVEELQETRDHTERLLKAMGVPVAQNGVRIAVQGLHELEAAEIIVPGDISSAAFFLVAAAITPDSAITVRNIGMNPARTGFVDVLRSMGATLEIENERESGGEPVADITCYSSQLRGVTIEGDMIPRLIDELPILAVAATQAEGVTVVRNAEELRVKESDRIATVVAELSRLGASIEATPDGFVIEGPARLRGATCQSHDDHRIAMSLAIAGLAARGETTIAGGDCVAISFPDFFELLSTVRKGA